MKGWIRSGGIREACYSGDNVGPHPLVRVIRILHHGAFAPHQGKEGQCGRKGEKAQNTACALGPIVVILTYA